ncbi:hypothetical protein WJX81_004922 [Elliptochloris bilobata]|uniref:RRM domain-containing protein n=1 Tax=Elliptochloris bilobata TaxID=381761 RepID=A0AAW1RX19_9CHLO
MDGDLVVHGKASRPEKTGKAADNGPALHASWLPKLQDAIEAAERARSRADESSARTLQAQRQMRSDAAALATAQEALTKLCREMCAAEGALAANGIPAGLTPLTPLAPTPAHPVRRGGRGRPGEAAPAERATSSAEAPAAADGDVKSQAPAVGNVLWVGGMGKGTSKEAIKRAFGEWGVEAVHLPDGADVATKGFAFLTFPTPEKATAAQETMDGAAIADGGKPIIVQG